MERTTNYMFLRHLYTISVDLPTRIVGFKNNVSMNIDRQGRGKIKNEKSRTHF